MERKRRRATNFHIKLFHHDNKDSKFLLQAEYKRLNMPVELPLSPSPVFPPKQLIFFNKANYLKMTGNY